MLRYLEIRNIALIDKVSIEFEPGLCVLTGETGAGKSIIIDSINAVLGARLDKEAVRAETGDSGVFAVFELNRKSSPSLAALFEENGLPVSDPENQSELVLSREVSESGRSICRINGKLVASSLLRAVGEQIVDLHGQHDNHSLMKREKHIDMIDGFGGAELERAKAAYSETYAQYTSLKKQIAELNRSEATRAREADMLTFQLNEIKAVKPKPNEDNLLEAEISLLSNAEKIEKSIGTAYALLGGADGDSAEAASAISKMSMAARSLSHISGLSPKYEALEGKINETVYLIEDIISGLRAARGETDFRPERLDTLSERLASIEHLKRKYGVTIRDIHTFYRDAAKRLFELTGGAKTVKSLSAELFVIEAMLIERAKALRSCRRRAADIVERGISKELISLEMKSARFTVNFESSDDPRVFSSKGGDKLEFLFSANAGEDVKPLVKIASGGEMSRVMLAIKSVLSDADGIPTMIFDEIDSGISGNAASRVAEKLGALSLSRQIICVTHLAQIACMADDQILIEKSVKNGETRTTVEKLTRERRVSEVSRLLGGGEPTEASLSLADEMLTRAAGFRNKKGGSVAL